MVTPQVDRRNAAGAQELAYAGRSLAVLRNMAAMSVEEFARRIGTSPAFLRQIETGTAPTVPSSGWFRSAAQVAAERITQ